MLSLPGFLLEQKFGIHTCNVLENDRMSVKSKTDNWKKAGYWPQYLAPNIVDQFLVAKQPDGDVLPHLRNLAVRSLLSMSRCVNMLITKMDSFVGTVKDHLLDSRGGAQCLVNHLLEPPSPSRSISCPFSV